MTNVSVVVPPFLQVCFLIRCNPRLASVGRCAAVPLVVLLLTITVGWSPTTYRCLAVLALTNMLPAAVPVSTSSGLHDADRAAAGAQVNSRPCARGKCGVVPRATRGPCAAAASVLACTARAVRVRWLK